jgi:hypothetical protein
MVLCWSMKIAALVVYTANKRARMVRVTCGQFLHELMVLPVWPVNAPGVGIG